MLHTFLVVKLPKNFFINRFNLMPKTCIVIAGPTVIGKTAYAIEGLQKYFETPKLYQPIADNFKELNI